MQGKRMQWVAAPAAICVALVGFTASAQEPVAVRQVAAEAVNRQLAATVIVDAPIEETWRAWTTEEGALTFFAPRSRVDLRTDGDYEMLFDLSAPEGSQGGEGLDLLAVQAPTFLSFEWNSPPHIAVRGNKTTVSVYLETIDQTRTRVTIVHSGWGRGSDWDQSYAYFTRAWGAVLGRLRDSYAIGPMNWMTRRPEPREQSARRANEP